MQQAPGGAFDFSELSQQLPQAASRNDSLERHPVVYRALRSDEVAPDGAAADTTKAALPDIPPTV